MILSAIQMQGYRGINQESRIERSREKKSRGVDEIGKPAISSNDHSSSKSRIDDRGDRPPAREACLAPESEPESDSDSGVTRRGATRARSRAALMGYLWPTKFITLGSIASVQRTESKARVRAY